VFAWLRGPASTDRPHRRCVEAQVMDLADDIAYSVHDVEDAVVGGHLDPARLADPDAVARLADQVRDWYLADASAEETAAALDRLRAMPTWVGSYDGSRRSLAALKDLTSQLIGRFARDVERATRARYGQGRLTRYGADVVVPRETTCEIAVLKGIAAVYVMTAAERQPLYLRQRELLAELYQALLADAPHSLEPAFAADWAEAGGSDADVDADDVRRRVVLDQVASLTDARAVRWHQALGLSSPVR
jgi:dGTPase